MRAQEVEAAGKRRGAAGGAAGRRAPGRGAGQHAAGAAPQGVLTLPAGPRYSTAASCIVCSAHGLLPWAGADSMSQLLQEFISMLEPELKLLLDLLVSYAAMP